MPVQTEWNGMGRGNRLGRGTQSLGNPSEGGMTDFIPTFRSAMDSDNRMPDAIVTVRCELCGGELPVEDIRAHLQSGCDD
jgi:hypothetical protein